MNKNNVVKFVLSFYVAVISGFAIFSDITSLLSLQKIIQPDYLFICELLISLAIFIFFILAQLYLHSDDKKNLKLANLYKNMYSSLSEQGVSFDDDGNGISPEHQLNTLLKRIFHDNLNFQTSERVSVYKYDREDKKIYRIGRHCPNVELSGQGSRFFYDNEGGVIGKAFNSKSDTLVIRKAPCPEVNYDAYKKFFAQKGADLKLGILNDIRMKSRAYWVFRTKDDQGYNSGLILFESTSPKAFSRLPFTKNSGKLKKMLKSEEGEMLLNMIKERRIPSENRERGL